jgi:hypothetical protein
MAAMFRATTQILGKSEAIVGKTAPAKWPKSELSHQQSGRIRRKHGCNQPANGLGTGSP